MKSPKLFFIGLLALVVALTACSSSSSDPAPPPPPAVGPVEGTTFDRVNLIGLMPSGTFSAAIAINNSDLAVGLADDGFGILGARWLLTTAAPVADALDPLDGHEYSAAYGLNDAGTAVGESGDTIFAAVYWTSGSTAALALSTTGIVPGANSAAYDINAQNEVVGEVGDGAGSTVAVFWSSLTADPLELSDLSANPGSSAYFINDGGVIVGESRNSAGQFQAVAWVPSSGVYGVPIALEAIAGQIASVAFGVDSAGSIVGEAELGSGVVHGLVWNTAGAVVDNIGANTSLQAISPGVDSDRLVGYVDALSGNDRSAVWNRLDLDDQQAAETPFSQAYGVNNFSDIVGVSDNQAFALLAQ